MDRNIVYPGSIPLDTDLLSVNRNTMIGLGFLARAILGTNTVVDGLQCQPTSPASMNVVVGPGSITQMGPIDLLAYGSIAADATDQIVKMGINISPTTFSLTAPSSVGQSVNYLIEAAFQEVDGNPVVLPYYNASNPAQSFSGPGNSGAPQNTVRTQSVQLQLKPGVPGNTGSQTTPVVDSGWVALYQITVSYGQTQVTAANIAIIPTAPFLTWKLPALRPGFGSGVQTFVTSGAFTVPAGVTQVEVESLGRWLRQLRLCSADCERRWIWRRLCKKAGYGANARPNDTGNRRRWWDRRHHRRHGRRPRWRFHFRTIRERDRRKFESSGDNVRTRKWRHPAGGRCRWGRKLHRFRGAGSNFEPRWYGGRRTDRGRAEQWSRRQPR